MLRTPDPSVVARKALACASFDFGLDVLYGLPTPALAMLIEMLLKNAKDPASAAELVQWYNITRRHLERPAPCAMDHVTIAWTQLSVQGKRRVLGQEEEKTIMVVRKGEKEFLCLALLKELVSSHFGLLIEAALVAPAPGGTAFMPLADVPKLVVKTYDIAKFSSGMSDVAGRAVLESPLREFKALQLMGWTHQNIIRAYAFAEYEGFYYSIVPYCETSLAKYSHELHRAPGRRITNEPDLRLFSGIFLPPLNFIKRAILHASAGLSFMHSRGIIHRDLSLDNILVTTDQSHSVVFKIIDFGLCKGLRLNEARDAWEPVQMDLDESGRPLGVGKASYEPPETFKHRCSGGPGPYLFDGPASDVWMLGIAALSVACGQLPFERASYLEYLSLSNRVDDVTKIHMMGDENYAMLVKAMLELDPARRPKALDVITFGFCQESA